MSSTKLWIYKMLTWWLPESRCFGFKAALLRWAGAKIGKNVRIYSSATFVGTGSLTIGDDVHIGSGVFMSVVSPAGIEIGNCIDIGPRVILLTGSHKINLDDAPSNPLAGHIAGEGTADSIRVADGCWLGARSMLLPGVVLSKKTIVAAGSIVTTSPQCEEKCLLAGSPASVKKIYCE